MAETAYNWLSLIKKKFSIFFIKNSYFLFLTLQESQWFLLMIRKPIRQKVLHFKVVFKGFKITESKITLLFFEHNWIREIASRKLSFIKVGLEIILAESMSELWLIYQKCLAMAHLLVSWLWIYCLSSSIRYFKPWLVCPDEPHHWLCFN